ncbi:MAG: regulatory protein RecX [Bdellovibrio sp.]
MSEEKDPLKSRQAAKRKIMDLLARRDHSEKELRQKLRDRFSDDDEVGNLVDEAIDFAKDNNWLGDPQTLAERMAEGLHRRSKGIHYINNYLKEKGLPTVVADHEQELEKACAIVKNKFAEDHKFSREEKARLARMLASRGFDSETVRKVIYEKL